MTIEELYVLYLFGSFVIAALAVLFGATSVMTEEKP